MMWVSIFKRLFSALGLDNFWGLCKVGVWFGYSLVRFGNNGGYGCEIVVQRGVRGIDWRLVYK